MKCFCDPSLKPHCILLYIKITLKAVHYNNFFKHNELQTEREFGFLKLEFVNPKYKVKKEDTKTKRVGKS